MKNKKDMMAKCENEIQKCNSKIKDLRDTESKELVEVVKHKEKVKDDLQNLYK